MGKPVPRISGRRWHLAAVGFALLANVFFAESEPVGEPSADFSALKTRLARTAEPMVWVITGDSITQGAKWTGPERSYPEIIQERLRYELNRRRDLIINSGISGEKAPGLLADFDWRVLQFKPSVVSVMIGMNDAAEGAQGRKKFETALREMVLRIRGAGAIPILHRTNPIDEESPQTASRADLAAYNDIIGRVAASEQVLLVDHWRNWKISCPDAPALRKWLADPIHPNAAGHRQLAIRFFQTVGIYDAAAITCQP